MVQQSKKPATDNIVRHFLFDVDGPLVSFLTKTGELILLSLMWIVTCLPVITIGAASAALYHTVVKSVRHDVGYPARSYIKNFRRFLKRGTLATIPLLIVTSAMYFFNRHVAHVEISLSTFEAKVFVILVIITLSTCLYLFPVISRFRVSTGQALMMAFIISVLPILSILFLPGILCFLSSLPMEKVLRNYMPDAPEKNSEAVWLYEGN